MDILEDGTTKNLIAAIENNIFEILSAFREWPKVTVHEDATIKWSITDIPFPLFNSVMRAQLTPDKIDPTIELITTHARSRKVPLLWWIGPQTLPADLGIHLERHGFMKEDVMPGMAVELASFNDNLPKPHGFQVIRVEDNDTLGVWCQTTGAGFGMPGFVIDAFYDLISHVGLEKMQCYLGWLNGKPVATSMQFLAAGVAGIYNVATIPEARRQGIGAVMTAYPLREAYTMDYQVGILGASEMGVDVYYSLGFRELCKIIQYCWTGDGE